MREQSHRRFGKYTLFGVLICIVALLIFWLHFTLDGGKLLDDKVSPDGKYVAEYHFYYQGGATVTSLKTVEIHTKINPFRHDIVDALDYGADLSIKWLDSRNLLITCPESGGRLDFYGKETKQHDVTIHYDLNHCRIAGAVH